MAGFIQVTDHQCWSVSNWVYWGLMDHLLAALVGDSQAAKSVEVCKWTQSMSLPLLQSDDKITADKILIALEEVAPKCAAGTLACKVDGRRLDEDSQRQFNEAALDLVDILRKLR